jgi:hypothetical protein
MFCTGEKTQLSESGTVSPMQTHVAWLQDFAAIGAMVQPAISF